MEGGCKKLSAARSVDQKQRKRNVERVKTLGDYAGLTVSFEFEP